MKLDIVDKKLLYALDRNARRSIAQIAKELSAHRNVILYRVKKLEETGVIRGYFTEVDMRKLGYIIFRVFIKIGNYTLDDEKRLIEYLKNIPQLMWFFQVQGKWDIDIVFAARTIDEFESFLSKLLQEFNKIIEEKSISLVTQIIHYPKDYLIDKKREKVQKKEFAQAEIKIDEKDKNILRAISERASIPLIELASQTRLSINTLKDRLRKMEKSKIILGYRPFIETEKTGYQYFKFILFFKNYTRYNIDNVRNFFEKNEKLVYLTDYVNGGDIEAEMHLESEQEMLVLKSLLVEKFGQYIKEITTIKFYKEHLYRYLPQTL